MAIFIRDRSVCLICSKLLEINDNIISFPAFVLNEIDPVHQFSDSVVHEKCLMNHELGEKALKRFNEWSANTGPGKRKCIVCSKEVMEPDDYLFIEHLTDKDERLKKYNYTHLHLSCINKWSEKTDVLILIKKLASSGHWRGSYLDWLIEKFS